MYNCTMPLDNLLIDALGEISDLVISQYTPSKCHLPISVIKSKEQLIGMNRLILRKGNYNSKQLEITLGMILDKRGSRKLASHV